MNNYLSTNFNHRLQRVAAYGRVLVSRRIASTGLTITPQQWTILDYLWEKDGIPLGELARLAQKDFANVTRIVDKLIRDKYLIKKKDITDKRSFLIFLTPKAIEIKDSIRQLQDNVTRNNLKGLSEEEQEMLISLLGRVESNMITLLHEME